MHKFILALLIAAILFCLLLVVGLSAAHAAERSIELSGFHVSDLKVQGFEVPSRTRVSIYMIGAAKRCCDQYLAYGWIIDAESREAVWTPQDDCHDPDRMSDILYECRDSVTLKPGKYELYYYVGDPSNSFMGEINITINDLGDLLGSLGDLMRDDTASWQKYTEEDVDEMMIRVTAATPLVSYQPTFADPAGTIFRVSHPGKNEFQRKAFSLTRETTFDIYAIGEFSESYEVFVDGSWIINADTREKVWGMDKWNTEHAGGADKNRYFHDKVTLPAGNYVANFATDDSHDTHAWNASPPVDPMNFGLCLRTVEPGDTSAVRPFDDRANETEIISLTRVRNDASEKTVFTLNKAAKIHIYALGERNISQDELVDYGWIMNADDRERVWTMTADNCGYAGGAAKNCLFDGLIDLPAGNYVVCYRTDDSHAYGDWNASEPFEPEKWGITLSGVGKDFDRQSFVLIEKAAPVGKVLVDMTRLGDDEDVERSFNLPATTEICYEYPTDSTATTGTGHARGWSTARYRSPH